MSYAMLLDILELIGLLQIELLEVTQEEDSVAGLGLGMFVLFGLGGKNGELKEIGSLSKEIIGGLSDFFFVFWGKKNLGV